MGSKKKLLSEWKKAAAESLEKYNRWKGLLKEVDAKLQTNEMIRERLIKEWAAELKNAKKDYEIARDKERENREAYYKAK